MTEQEINALEKAVAEGDKMAMYELGTFYYNRHPRNVMNDEKYRGYLLVHEAAENGIPQAEFMMGRMQLDWHIHTDDKDMAVDALLWLNQAHHHGVEEAEPLSKMVVKAIASAGLHERWKDKRSKSK